MIPAILLAAALALLAPPGAQEAALLAALFTSVGIATALGVSASFFTAAAAFTLNVIVGSVVSFALSKVTAALAGKPKAPKVPPFGVQASLRTGGDVPRSIIVGRGVTAGSLVWANTWGNPGDVPNEYLTQVIALSDMPIHGVTQLFVNGQAVSFGAGTVNSDSHGTSLGVPITQYTRNGREHLWIKVWTGNQIAPDLYLRDVASSAERPWQNTRIGTGVAYAVMTTRFSRDVWTGVPQFRFECVGVPLYDITRDSTAGGTGAHRWNDPVTWTAESSTRRNAAVILYNLLRGVRFGGQWVMGLQGLDAAQLPAARWIAAVSAAYDRDFLAGGEIAFDTELGDTVEALLASCEGRLADNAGTFYTLTVGAPASAVASFTDDDVISTAEQTFTPFPGLADTVNGVIFTYPRPSQAWAVTQAPPLYDAALEAEDGGRRMPVTIDMPMVSNDEQAQRLAKAALAEARRARRHTLTLPPQFWPLEPGDVVSWTSERNGYVAKLFRVDGIVDLPDLDVLVDLTETDPSDYDWDPLTDYTAPVDGFLAPVAPPVQSTSISVAPHTITVGGVGRRPAIALSWTAAPADVTGIDWQVRVAATVALVAEGTAPGLVPGGSGSTILSSGLVPNTGYQVRARWVPGTQRPVDWSAWLSVTTPDVRLGVAEFAAGIEPVGIVATGPLPTTKSTEVIFYAPDDKLYRWNGTAYVSTVPAVDVTGQLSDAQIAAIAAAKITGTITEPQIATGAVTDAKIAGVAAAKLTGQIVGTQITDGAVSAPKIAAGAVIAGKIAANAVTATEIAAGAVTAGKVAASAITATEIAAGAVTAVKIAAGAVETAKLAAGAVTADTIAANAVTAAKIGAGAVEAAKIAAGAVTADKLAANSVVAGKIAAGAISTSELAADAVTAEKINVTSLDAISANLGTISVGTANIADAAVQRLKIAGEAVDLPRIQQNALVITAAGGIGPFTTGSAQPNPLTLIIVPFTAGARGAWVSADVLLYSSAQDTDTPPIEERLRMRVEIERPGGSKVNRDQMMRASLRENTFRFAPLEATAGSNIGRFILVFDGTRGDEFLYAELWLTVVNN